MYIRGIDNNTQIFLGFIVEIDESIISQREKINMKNLLLLLLVPIVLLSCARTKVLMYGESYPPKPDNFQVEIYRTKVPEKDYVEIAEISNSDSNDKYAIRSVMDKARNLGADAIIILGAAGSGGIGIPSGNIVITSTNEYGIRAVAIKYTE